MKHILVVILAVVSVPAWAGTVNGRVVWTRVAQLGFPVSGVVERVAVQPGQRVARGDELVILDQQPFHNAVRRSQAVLDGRMPARQEAEREVQRAEELYDRAVSSDYELNQARVQFADADAAYRVAQTERNSAGWELDHSRLVAPFDGLVLAVHTVEGESIVSRQAVRELVSLADLGSLAVLARVSARQAGQIAGGAELNVQLGGETRAARMAWLVPAAGADAEGYDLAVTLPIEVLDGRVGQAATIEYRDD